MSRSVGVVYTCFLDKTINIFVTNWCVLNFVCLTAWLPSCLPAWLTIWRPDWRPDWLPDYLTACQPACLTDYLTAWLTDGPDWLTDYLTAWLTDWLSDGPDWLPDYLTACQPACLTDGLTQQSKLLLARAEVPIVINQSKVSASFEYSETVVLALSVVSSRLLSMVTLYSNSRSLHPVTLCYVKSAFLKIHANQSS